MRLLAISILIFATSLLAHSQRYITAMGIRMGTDMGITLQQRLLSHTTIEGIFTTSAVTNTSTGTVLLQLHNPLITKSLNFYVGGGFHNRWVHEEGGNRLSLRGVTGIAGAELTLGRINLAWDFKPVYHLNTTEGQYETETAISLRYILVKKGKRKKRKGQVFPSSDGKDKRKRSRKRKKNNNSRGKKSNSYQG